MSKKIFEDSRGNKSSKRVAGFILLLVGLIMGIILFYFSIYRTIGDSITAMNVMNTFLMAGGGLLGIGIFEKTKK